MTISSLSTRRKRSRSRNNQDHKYRDLGWGLVGWWCLMYQTCGPCTPNKWTPVGVSESYPAGMYSIGINIIYIYHISDIYYFSYIRLLRNIAPGSAWNPKRFPLSFQAIELEKNGYGYPVDSVRHQKHQGWPLKVHGTNPRLEKNENTHMFFIIFLASSLQKFILLMVFFWMIFWKKKLERIYSS